MIKILIIMTIQIAYVMIANAEGIVANLMLSSPI
jgi:hypothetical protein